MSEKLGIHESMQREGLHISEARDFRAAQRNTEEYRAIHELSLDYHEISLRLSIFTPNDALCCTKLYYMSLFQIGDVHRLSMSRTGLAIRNQLPLTHFDSSSSSSVLCKFQRPFQISVATGARQPTDKKWNILAVFLA